MLTDLTPQPPDRILELMQLFRDDPRADRIDLGVGVYRNAAGATPVMRAVKAAERRLVEAQETKAYTSLGGDPAFCGAMRDLLLKGSVDAGRVAVAAAPGGTGAIRQGIELMRQADRAATAWMPAPTWPNHLTIARHMGVRMREYRYFDSATRDVDFDGMIADLEGAGKGDVVLLHGCCHNPTGADLTAGQWEALAERLAGTGAVPFVDIAYQGFGDGLDEDAFGTRLLASRMPEMLVAASCSKNFGVYRERAGVLMAVAPDAASRPRVQATLAYLNRQNFSFPPDHGARVVQTVLDDPGLRADWQTELEDMRVGMLGLREQLAGELRMRSNSERFDFITRHRGMFSRIGATPEQVLELREIHGIYMAGDSRINLAGLNSATVPVLAQAIIDVGV